jgi:phage baseplate assembly protein W
MATGFNADKFTATTTQSLLYSDIFTNFTVHPELHDLTVKKNEEAVKQAILNLIATNKYERPFQPDFGSNIRNYLFEPINPVTQQGIKEAITNAIDNHEPRAKLISVVVTPYIDENAYSVSIVFYIININTPVTLTTILHRVR